MKLWKIDNDMLVFYKDGNPFYKKRVGYKATDVCCLDLSDIFIDEGDINYIHFLKIHFDDHPSKRVIYLETSDSGFQYMILIDHDKHIEEIDFLYGLFAHMKVDSGIWNV